MLKTAIAASIVLGSVSFASAMPMASSVQTGASLPVVKAAVIVKKVVRRPPVRRTVVRKTIIRR
ncbi:hypothetical protein RHAL1_01074 [Beijerinckiaceae bacterium RH AL1]|jgi:hypothetical protein|nr:hypothetical protein [Beijerinckiaceae bacterium]VVB44123.1 hypothetical protein RHCH11_RHCH11_01050 [Beijerinckiaceae bacterium RH CH11]VVB44150.1 hypothetical protein RHAL8_01047 [Beijerinckiaceae bacterium RH AL8]VVC54181.1 hypothetical protein RHAL1_01074 [Beijerinckiaceae bacterium RH AL1]